MSPVHLTSSLVNSELRANRAGHRGVDGSSARSFSGGHRATPEYTSSSHTYSVPVVREMPPRQVRFIATW